MNQYQSLSGVWFVYDGDCPVCQNAAQAMKLKKELGALNLLNARTDYEHPLMQAINDQQLNLDDGMVIYHQNQFFHGKRALEFMAIYARPKGIFNRVNRLLFRSRLIASVSYPWMRGVRNLLLLIRGKTKINNLQNSDQPIFKGIFGESWEKLPPVMHKHYANRPLCDEVNIVEGKMDVRAALVLRIFSPISKLLGGIPVVNATEVPVTVRFESNASSDAFHFNRIFYFPNKNPYVFHSRMVPQGGNKAVEQMKFGLGWQVAFQWHDNKVILAHNGYCLCLLGKFIPLPLNWLLGTVHAEEQALNATSFKMFVEIRHWLFGKIYEYRGTFHMVTNHE